MKKTRKEENKTESFLYSWLPSGSYHKTLKNWNLLNSKFGEFGSFCFSGKILCLGKNHSFHITIKWVLIRQVPGFWSHWSHWTRSNGNPVYSVMLYTD
jgi:hypothetical protein